TNAETTPDPISEDPIIPEPAPEIVDEIVYQLKYAYAYNSPIKYDLDQLLLDSPAYISVYPETDISRVLFYHLDNGAETLVHTELAAPYDYFGTNFEVTPDQIPEEGRTIIAVVTLEDGQSKTLQATITKSGEITVDPEPVIVVDVPEPEVVPAPAPISDELLPISIDATNPNSVVIEFSTQTQGQVSAAVYNEAGRLIRTLLRGKVLEAGNHTVLWDGFDRDGDAVGPGDYTFKVLRSDGLKSEFVTNLGINPDSSSYDTWVGNHEGGASSVAVDASGVYIAAEITETAPVLIKQSLDGKTRFWSKERIDVTNGRFQGGASLAADGNGRVYMLQQNGYLQVIDAATGNLIASWDILPSSVNRGNELFLYMHEIDALAGADMEASGDTIVVSFKSSNLVAWINPSNGGFETQFSVDAPRGVAITADEEALVLSGDALYGLRPGQSRTLISSGLSEAQRITYDASSDTLLITFGIKGAQVKRYSMAGTLIETYGKAGGRVSGPYIAEDFYSVRDISADGTGGFFVTEPEAQPRRIARFNAAGLLIDEWYGGQNYYAWAEPDPRIPGSAWMFTNEGFVHANINLDSGVWEVVGAWMLEDLADGLIKAIAGHHGRWRVLYNGDDCYLVSELIPQVLSYKNGVLKAVSISSNDAEQLEKAVTMTGESSSPDSFRWLDQNGDGRPQKSEFTFSKYGEVPTGTHIQSDFSYLGYDRQNDAVGLLRSEVQWSDLGPYYPIGRETDFDQEIASTPTQERASSRGINVFASKDGDFYTHYNLSVENHGVYWPTHWASISRFVKWDENGNEMWSVGRHAYHGGLAGTHSTTYVKTPPGQFHVLARVIGEVGNNVVLADRVESMGMVWSKDGLLVGSLFDRRADDGLPEEVYSWYLTSDSKQAITTTDNASGGSIIEYEDGTVLWFTQGRNSVPVYKVSGWEDMDRDEASFKLSSKASLPEAKGTGLVARYFKGNIDSTPDVKVTDSQVWHGIDGLDDVIDGADGPVYDWSNGPAGLGQSSGFTARWKGEVEVPLTEEFIFSLYARGGVRLWIDGQQVIYSWNEITDKVESLPIKLEAGKRYALQLDFITTQSDPALSLNWESLSLDRHRIPSKYLYPVDSATALKQVRDAADYINAADYDVESGDMEDWLVDEYAVEGVGQRGLGKSGAYIGYTTVDLGSGFKKLKLQGSASPSRSTDTYPINLAFRLGSPSGPNIAEVDMTGVLRTFSVDLENTVSGVQDIYVINTTSNDKHSIDFRWFKFE
ncbi:MAG: PA14 domain-containing protein, partial [Verrucomicrobiota bacterium]